MFQIRNVQPSTTPTGAPSWRAELVQGRDRIPVHRDFGSWLAELPGGLFELLGDWPERLQAKVRPMERKAARAAERTQGGNDQ